MLSYESDADEPIVSTPQAPHIPLPFRGVMKDVLKVRPPEKEIRRQKVSDDFILGWR
jgi:hypothetical protein